MFKKTILVIGAALLLGLNARAQSDATYDPVDSIEVEKLLNEADGGQLTPLYFAEKLLGRPYVGQTLEVNGDVEKLVVNLRELDCTTLVENAVALAMAHNKGGKSFSDFCGALLKIRYKSGLNSGYSSRLHYFSQWINDNCRMGITEDVGADGKYPFIARQRLDLHFMTRNPQYYRQLKDNPLLCEEILKEENAINGLVVNYIPKNLLNQPQSKLSAIHDGDIIALVTNKDGLDISHVGIAVWENNRLHLLNASSLQNKVILDNSSLYNYQKKRASQLGIRVIRLR